MTMMKSRGFRNNNPGNLRKDALGKWKQWQGLAAQQTDYDFVQFDTPIWGMRALARTLMTYQDKYGLNTIDQFIKKFAPPSENNTKKYRDFVVKATGIAANEPMRVHEYDTMKALMIAIMDYENDGDGIPYSKDEVNAALIKAGVEVPAPKMAASTTMTSAQVGAGSVGLQATLEGFKDQLSDYWQFKYVQYALLGITLVTLIVIGYERIKKMNNGLG